jgi:hypothetical protein
MDTLCRVEKKGRGARTRQGGCDLLANLAGLAHSRHDNFSSALIEQIHRLAEAGIDPFDEGADGFRLDGQDAFPLLDAPVLSDRSGVAAYRASDA